MNNEWYNLPTRSTRSLNPGLKNEHQFFAMPVQIVNKLRVVISIRASRNKKTGDWLEGTPFGCHLESVYR